MFRGSGLSISSGDLHFSKNKGLAAPIFRRQSAAIQSKFKLDAGEQANAPGYDRLHLEMVSLSLKRHTSTHTHTHCLLPRVAAKQRHSFCHPAKRLVPAGLVRNHSLRQPSLRTNTESPRMHDTHYSQMTFTSSAFVQGIFLPLHNPPPNPPSHPTLAIQVNMTCTETRHLKCFYASLTAGYEVHSVCDRLLAGSSR